MAIATYCKEKLPPDRHPLLSVFMPSFINSIQSALDRYRFAIYLGTQVDLVWDDPELRNVRDCYCRCQ
jgi:hypothetical protein